MNAYNSYVVQILSYENEVWYHNKGQLVSIEELQKSYLTIYLELQSLLPFCNIPMEMKI